MPSRRSRCSANLYDLLTDRAAAFRRLTPDFDWRTAQFRHDALHHPGHGGGFAIRRLERLVRGRGRSAVLGCHTVLPGHQLPVASLGRLLSVAAPSPCMHFGYDREACTVKPDVMLITDMRLLHLMPRAIGPLRQWADRRADCCHRRWQQSSHLRALEQLPKPPARWRWVLHTRGYVFLANSGLTIWSHLKMGRSF